MESIQSISQIMRAGHVRQIFIGLTISLGLSCGSVQAQVLYADDFNRSASTNLGVTSTGGYAWVENKPDTNSSNNADASIVSSPRNAMRLESTSGNHDAVNAYVSYDLDSQSSYTVTFGYEQLQLANSQGSGFLVLPRAQGTDIVGNVGWIFRAPTSNSTTFDVYLYNGGARTGGATSHVTLGSVLATGFATSSLHSVSISVVNNLATLTIGSTTVDSNRSLGSVWNNGTPDRVMFAYNPVDTMNRLHTSYVSDLVVVPEPST